MDGVCIRQVREEEEARDELEVREPVEHFLGPECAVRARVEGRLVFFVIAVLILVRVLGVALLLLLGLLLREVGDAVDIFGHGLEDL